MWRVRENTATFLVEEEENEVLPYEDPKDVGHRG